MPRHTCVLVAVTLVAGAIETAIGHSSLPAKPDDSRDTVTVRLVDTSGSPIADAWVGAGASGTTRRHQTDWTFFSSRAPSDSEGRATLSGIPAGEGKLVLYALQEPRGLAGLLSVPAEELGEEVTLTLEPACRVHGHLESSGLTELGRPIGWTNVYIHLDGNRPLSYSSDGQEYEFHLPPGTYELEAYGTDLESIRHRIEIEPGQRELELDAIDLPPTKLATLFGRPAPELEQITGWKNGEPITLEQLHGSVVVLDFWGYWCGPCLRAMPGLMALHDAFADKGLVVIAIHDGSAQSIEEIDKRVAGAKKGLWSGRDLPFPVALDGEGATIEAYGIQQFPTTLLIDQQGRLLKEVHTTGRIAGVESEIAKLLGVEGEPLAWRERFDRVYRLEPGEVLRRIPSPFIPERSSYITHEFDALGFGYGSPRDRLVFRWDGQLSRAHVSAETLIALLRQLTVDSQGWRATSDTFECADDLRGIVVSGDWIIRTEASLEDRLMALERILRDDFGLMIRFELWRAERDVVTVSGRNEPIPKAENRPKIHISADDQDLASVIGGGSGTLADLLAALSILYDLRFLDETKGSPDIPIRWEQHDSSLGLDRLPEVLANLSRQTSLEFRRQTRPVDVWFVVLE